MWEPNGRNNIISLSENCIFYYDCNTSAPKVTLPYFIYLQNILFFSLFKLFTSVKKKNFKLYIFLGFLFLKFG